VGCHLHSGDFYIILRPGMSHFCLEEGYRRALCEDLQAIVGISLEKSGDAANVSVTILEYIILQFKFLPILAAKQNVLAPPRSHADWSRAP
jgi:hypothetical protein